MKQVFLSVFLAVLALSGPVYARATPVTEKGSAANVVGFINSLKTENTAYYTGHKSEFFSELSKGQNPIATVISCSDSRVHTNMLSANPEGRLYVVRDLGNQLATAEGSVEYGIHQLQTPVLLIIGHTRCGAISAVTGDYSKEPPAIKHELDTITIAKDLNNLDGVNANVHNQVAAAMLKFADELNDRHLTIVGAVFDFADDMHQGAGKLNIINVNGETDAAKLGNLESWLGKPAAPAARKQKKTAH